MQRRFGRQAITMLGALLCGAAVAVVVMLAVTQPEGAVSDGVTLRDDDTSYDFIKPLLACDVGGALESSSLASLKAELTTIIDAAKARGDVEEASVYYRDLDSSAWTAVNIDVNYAPASLMKVPILMAYLQQAQQDPGLLATTVTITVDPSPGTMQDIAPSESVAVGETYTVEELLRLMVAHSDNRALNVLMQGVDVDVLDEILDDLGVPIPAEQGGYTISARLYSRFFRILYNATYLWPESSEDALAMLAETAFDGGLRAGVPESIALAHKFGEAAATLADGSTGHELHDCGIVYVQEPYALCVMTRGKDVDALATVVADISRAAFE